MGDYDKIKNLKDGESYIVPESDFGRAEIWRKNDRYFLFSIPYGGGTPVFENAYSLGMISVMMTEFESWT